MGTCKKILKKRSRWLAVMSLLAIVPTVNAQYTKDPSTCNGTGGSIGISVFACTSSNPATCTTPVTSEVLVGEWIGYQVDVGPQGGKCGFALGTSGTFTLTLPNNSVVDLSADTGQCGAALTPCTAASNATTGACIGCDVGETGGTVGSYPIFTGTANGYTGAIHTYQVASGDISGGFITASTRWGGSGVLANDIAFTTNSSTTEPPGPELSTPQSNPAGTCGAKVDKQVSCNGGNAPGGTWEDVTGSDDASGTSNLGCIAAVGANVEFQFIASNTGAVSITCDLADSVTTILPSTTVTIGSGLSVTIAGTTTACNLTDSQTGDNTATLGSCSCTIDGVSVPGTGGTDEATYACCGVQLDKQVSCNGGAFTDVGLVSNNEDGTKNCTAIDGQTVAIQYQYKNTGNIPLVCSGTSTVDGVTTLGLIDVYNSPPQSCTTSADCAAGSGVCNTGTHLCEPLLLTGEGTLAGGVTSSFISNSSVTTCSSQLSTDEATGNTATIDCECAATSQFATAVSASADDAAKIVCGTPKFAASKSCKATGTGTFTSDVTVTNTGNVGESCAVVDQYVPGACTTLPTCPLADVVDVPLGNNPIVLAASPANCTGASCVSGDATGPVPPTGTLSASVCNQACVTCTPTGGGSALTPVAVQATCPVGSCFSRTPGYWGTHPAQTAQVITLAGGSLEVCGEALTTVDTSVGSAIQNLCESGKDFKAAGTSPQQLQLIRQCTAAALNLAAAGDGSILAGAGSCEGLDPGITETFNSCCDELGASVCNEGASKATINASACITELDAFNNQFDNTPFPSTITNSSAKPATCKASNGDGVTNCSSTGGTIDCGPAK